MPMIRRVKPEPRTPATQADDGGAGGCFGRAGREPPARGPLGREDPGRLEEPLRFAPAVDPRAGPAEVDDPGFLPPGFAGAGGVSGSGRRGAEPGAEGRRGGRAMAVPPRSR
ncbi:hypothetical protein B0T42_17240 [Rathayibacter sp. VKM Ac-2630]|nr:hypothetical protein B0T42_17240 [Rathayibacter sp. VKM Ac-2630]